MGSDRTLPMPDAFAPDTSLRFTRAASAELKRLDRKRSRLLEKREEFQQAIGEIDQAVEALEDRMRLLSDLAPPSGMAMESTSAEAMGAGGKAILRGARIRDVAVPMLLREMGESPVHYRRWYELVTSAGYEILGKRPDAVFLNQVARSPLVKASTRPGIYSIDLDAIERLQAALDEQQALLAEENETASGAESSEDRLERHQELETSIARLRRELDEARRAIEAGEHEKTSVAHAA